MEPIILLAILVTIALNIFVLIAVGKLFSIERSLRQLASPQSGGLLSMVNQIAVNTSPTLLPALIAIELNTRPRGGASRHDAEADSFGKP
jgi:hypothetical protein